MVYNNEEVSSYLNASVDTENPFKTIKKELSELEHILEELGIWSFTGAFEQSLLNISIKSLKLGAKNLKYLINILYNE